MNKWYFAVENNPSNNFSDEFTDSKFSIDKWNSFVREIIQNSIDVNIDESKPVRIVFDHREIPTEMIPGMTVLLENFELCLKEELNIQTKTMYEQAVNILKKPTISCLKISDFNTKGVETDINGDWGAFVYDNGRSSKPRPGSAGSHGVGKKAPFLVSSLNTVFYNTKYYLDNSTFFEGKTSLVNFTKNDIVYSPKGWFGNVDEEIDDRRLKVQPIKNFKEILCYDDFFTRRQESGTDVIVVGALLNPSLEEVKNKIINAVLENFFIGLIENKLVVEVFGTEINNENIDEIVDKYYQNDTSKQTKIAEYDSVRNGNLRNYLLCLKENPQKIDVKINGRLYGYLDIYFTLKNDKNKKYYCLFRDHGMKIQDIQLNTDQPFSAVIVTRNYDDSPLEEKERLNAKLGSRENAAHDKFIINDDKCPCDEETELIIKKIYQEIEKFIKDATEISATDDTPIYSLTDMMSIEGSVSTVNIKKVAKISKKRKKIIHKDKVTQSDKYENAIGSKENKNSDRTSVTPGPNKPAKTNGDDDGIVYDDFIFDPKFYHFADYYELRVQPKNDILCNLKIVSYSVDGGTQEFPFMIESAVINDHQLEIKNSTIQNIALSKDSINKINIKLRKGLDYNLESIILVRK